TIGTLSGFVGSERVTATGSAEAFSSGNVGGYTTSVAYTLADGSSGGKAANYTLAPTSGVSGSVTAKALSISAPSIAAKTYDGSTAAGVLTIGTLSGFVGSETVTATGTAAAFSSANVGAATSTVSYTLGNGANGGLATNYSLASTPNVNGSITAKALTVAGATAQSKTYDGTTAATITGSTLVGVVGGETVTVGGGGLFASRTVGVAKAVTAQLVLGGAAAGNYTLTQPTGLTADITAKQLTLTGAAAQNKTYDGTTAATITGTLSGVVTGDSVAYVGSGTFASANRGTAIAVTPNLSIYSPTGASSTNYTIAQPAGLTANITIGQQSIAAVNIGTRIIGGSITMPATSSQGQAVSYASSDPSIASVSGSVITFNAAGFAKITASAAGTGNYEAYSYTQTVKVLAAVDAAAITLGAGDVVVLGYNAAANNPDYITLMFLRDLTPGTTFFVSDNEVIATGGSTFADLNEAEASFTVKSGQVVSAGTVLTLPWGTGTQTTDQYDWTVADSSPGLGAGGDEIYIYNAAAITDTRPTSFIFGVAYGSSPSQRPNGLVDGQTFIRPTGDTMRYKTSGATYAGAPATLRSAIGNTGINWESGDPQVPTVANYTFLLPQPQLVTFTAPGAKTYGDASFQLSASAFSGGQVAFVSSDSTVASIVGTTVTILKAGSATITASVAGNDQFLAASATQSLTVAQKGITVTADAKSKTYGDADPALTYVAAGLVGSDTLAGSLGRAAGQSVGTYAINVGSLANPNYSISSFTGANLVVNAKALTITAGVVTKAGNQTLSGGPGSTAFTASGLVTGETIGSVSIGYGAAGTAGYNGGASGTYADQVIPSAATGGTFTGSNYTIGYVSGSIIVNSS
ncbi:MAG: YDG domain-containing protein, partial [Planctomycetota bacterium]